MELLNEHEALELFCWNAFKVRQPPTRYEDVSNHAVRYAKSLPLALKIIGRNLIGKSVEECECALEQYERIPEREIHDILKVSYDCLEETAKNIFLDIACFFKRERLDYVEKILAACDFGPKYYIGILVDKSLLSIENGCLMMHDLIQDMGVEIVRMEAPSKPGKRSRLFHHEDVLKVLTENSGSSNIEGILLNLKRKEEKDEEEEEIEWSGRAFDKMKNLRILIIQNVHFSVGPNYLPNSLRVLEWEQYPLESLPCDFSPRKLALLSLPNSCVKLKKSLKKSIHLVDLRLSKCKFITHVPDMSGVPSLRQLILDGCENLIEIHESVGLLKHLTDLDVSKCTKISSLLSSMWLPSLSSLHVEGCKKLERMPDIVGEMKMLEYLDLGETCIEELPQSIGNITRLKQLRMGFRNSLKYQKLCNMWLQKDSSLYLEASAQGRESFTRFQSIHLLPIICNDLGSLRLEGCGLTDEDLQLILKYCLFLYDLCVPWNHFVHLLACIKEYVHLRSLFVSECMMLRDIPELPSSTRNIEALNCPHLTSESTSVLWSKALKEETNLRIMVPEARIPDWFDHRYDGDTLSFWTRKNIPHIAMTFIFKEHDGILQWATPDSLLNIVFQFYINGHGALPGISMFFSTVVEDLTLLYDLNPGFIKQLSPDALKQDDWNHVEIKCTLKHFTTIECGVYVYKQETNMDDIQFNSPNQLKIGDQL